jgi:TATA-box binding protein (TBP) (component of TFIID and TFIIIB)
MAKFSWNDYKFLDFINFKKHEVDNLPNGVSISTMCCSAKIGSEINIENIQNYLQLNKNDILTVKMNDQQIRTLLEQKKKNKRKKIGAKKNQKFYNQITVVIRINHGEFTDINDEKTINVKLFKNGSIQMSGCKRIEEVNNVINKLIYRLKEKKGRKTDDKIEHISFVENANDIDITNFKIDMINSNYQVNLQIDRSKFYRLLLKKKISASYEKCIRACVIIKYCPPEDNIDQKEISIFIFQKGNIIITGAKSRNQVTSAYNHLNKILIEHADEISKKDEKEDEDNLISIYKNILDENSHKLDLLMIN